MSVTDSAVQPDANQEPTGQANSPDYSGDATVATLLSEVTQLKAQVNSLRSEKDKSVVRTNQRLSEFEERQAQLVAMAKAIEQYGSPDEAARQMAITELLQGSNTQITAPPAEQTTAPAGQDNVAPQETDLVTLLGVNPSSAEFIAEISSGKTANQAAIAIASARAAGDNVNPNAASGLNTGGKGGAPDAATQSALEARYQNELSTVPQGDWRAIVALKNKYRRDGLEKW